MSKHKAQLHRGKQALVLLWAGSLGITYAQEIPLIWYGGVMAGF